MKRLGCFTLIAVLVMSPVVAAEDPVDIPDANLKAAILAF